jgi:hypothetical protein
MNTFGAFGFNPNQPIFFQLHSFVKRSPLQVIRNYFWVIPFAYLGSVFLLFERFEIGARWLWRCWLWNKKHPLCLALLGIHLEQVQQFKKAHTVWQWYSRYFPKDLSLFLRMAHTKNQINLHLDAITLLNELLTQYTADQHIVAIEMMRSNAYEAHKDYYKAFKILQILNQKGLLKPPQKETLILKAYKALQYEYGDTLLAELPYKELKLALFQLDLWNEKNENDLLLQGIDQLVHEYPNNKNVLWQQYTIYSNHFYKSKATQLGEQLETLLGRLEKIKNWYEPRILNEKIRLAILRQQKEKAMLLIQKLPNNHSKFVLKVKMWEAHVQGNWELEQKLWRLFKKLYFVPQIQPPSNHELTLMSGNPHLDSSSEIPLFTCIKNERDRLAWFLAYYRKLGVTKFFFIDNNSSDGSREYLQTQPDVVLFLTTEKYARGYSGIKWINHLIRLYGGEHWCLYVDVDEALVYPDSERIILSDYTQKLEAKGYQALHAPMLDMFQLAKDSHPDATKDYTVRYPYYLSDRKTIGTLRPPYLSDFGGIRKYFKVYEAHTKIPLIHSKHKIQLLNSSHNISPAKVLVHGGVLLHYRVVDNFIEKTQNELNNPDRVTACMARLQTYVERASNISYEKLAKDPDLRTFTTSADLIEEGILQTIAL